MVKKKTAKKSNSHIKTTKKSTTKNSKKKKCNKKILIAGLAVVVIIVALIAMFNPFQGEETNVEQENLVAIVNGEQLYQSDLQAEYTKLPEQFQLAFDDKIVLSQLIDKKLLALEAKDSEIDVDKELENIAAQNGITMEEVLQNVETQGMTEEEFREQIKTYLFLQETLFANIQVTDQELQNYYTENPEMFKVKESVLAQHILVSTTDRTEEEAMNIMSEIEGKLAENFSNFCDLVTEYSEDPGSVPNCGQYPPFDRDSSFVQEYKDAAFDNEVGSYTVVKTQFGYHLIYTVEKYPAREVKLEEVAEQLRENIAYEKQKTLFSQYIEELRANAEIINCLETPDAEECTTETPVVEIEEEIEEVEVASTDNTIEELAKCLSEKDAKMFGAYWCSHCNAQKDMFGDAWEYITYVECSEEDNPRAQTPDCADAEISGYPTWVINGKQYPGKQTFENLAKLSGC